MRMTVSRNDGNTRESQWRKNEKGTRTRCGNPAFEKGPKDRFSRPQGGNDRQHSERVRQRGNPVAGTFAAVGARRARRARRGHPPCGGREGRALNHRYRRKDYATNVLSFPYESGREMRGDIVLCAPVVAREARKQQKTLDAHYAHLTIHGILQLRGYDHDTDAGARIMENRERRVLLGLGFSDPYA